MRGLTPAGAVFFDRDGVLNVDKGYVHRVKDFQWTNGAKAALRMVRDAGLLAIVVTNQSGIARGFYRTEDVDALHRWMNEELRTCGAHIAAFYICPFNSTGIVPQFLHPDHPDRKPNPGMLLRAMSDWNVDPRRSVMFGDRSSDMEAAHRAGIGGVLYGGDDLCVAVGRWLAENVVAETTGSLSAHPSSLM